MASKTKPNKETSEFPIGPVDPDQEMELDDGTPVERYFATSSYIAVRLLPGAKATRKGQLFNINAGIVWYKKETGVYSGGDPERYKVLRNRQAVEPPEPTASTPINSMPDTSITSTLSERGSRYGSFQDNSSYAQDIKLVYRGSASWPTLADDQREALDMVASKISRILSGDPHYRDNWHDMVGYLKLVDDRMADDGL